jgi:hypothetical protein
VADVDPALGQEIFDVSKRQRVSHIHHHDQTDDLRRAVEISERIAQVWSYHGETHCGLFVWQRPPDIVQAAVDGILPRGLGVSRLMDMPPSWADRRSIIGIAPRHWTKPDIDIPKHFRLAARD